MTTLCPLCRTADPQPGHPCIEPTPRPKHSYRCAAYLVILADAIPGENLVDVDRRTSEAVDAGALSCTCYVQRHVDIVAKRDQP